MYHYLSYSVRGVKQGRSTNQGKLERGVWNEAQWTPLKIIFDKSNLKQFIFVTIVQGMESWSMNT